VLLIMRLCDPRLWPPGWFEHHLNSTCCWPRACGPLAAVAGPAALGPFEPAVRACVVELCSCWAPGCPDLWQPRRGDRLGISPPPAAHLPQAGLPSKGELQAGGIDRAAWAWELRSCQRNCRWGQGPAGPSSRRSTGGGRSRARCPASAPSPPRGRRCSNSWPAPVEGQQREPGLADPFNHTPRPASPLREQALATSPSLPSPERGGALAGFPPVPVNRREIGVAAQRARRPPTELLRSRLPGSTCPLDSGPGRRVRRARLPAPARSAAPPWGSRATGPLLFDFEMSAAAAVPRAPAGRCSGPCRGAALHQAVRPRRLRWLGKAHGAGPRRLYRFRLPTG